MKNPEKLRKEKAKNADPKTGYTLYLNNVKIWCKTKRQVQSKIGKENLAQQL